MAGQAIISQRVLKQSHGEFDAKDSAHSIINTAHRDNLLLRKEGEIIDESSVVVWYHDLCAHMIMS